jgi:hypothetical protein
MALSRIITNAWKTLLFSIIAILAVTTLSSISNVIPYASASSTLVCTDAQNNDVRDMAPIPLKTSVKCTATTDNQRVIGGQWVVHDGDGRLHLSSPFKSSSDSIIFVTYTPKLWTVQVSYFDNVGQNFTPPIPLTASTVSFVVSSYGDNLPPKAVISVIK